MGCGAAGSLLQYGHHCRVRRVRKGPADEQEIDSTTALRSEFMMVKPSCAAFYARIWVCSNARYQPFGFKVQSHLRRRTLIRTQPVKRFCKKVATLAEGVQTPTSIAGKYPGYVHCPSQESSHLWGRTPHLSHSLDRRRRLWRGSRHKQLEPIPLEHGFAALGKELSVSDLHTSFGHTCLNAFAHNTSCKHCHGTCPRACFCDVTLSFALHGNLNQNYEDILQFLTRLIWLIWLIWLAGWFGWFGWLAGFEITARNASAMQDQHSEPLIPKPPIAPPCAFIQTSQVGHGRHSAPRQKQRMALRHRCRQHQKNNGWKTKVQLGGFGMLGVGFGDFVNFQKKNRKTHVSLMQVFSTKISSWVHSQQF